MAKAPKAQDEGKRVARAVASAKRQQADVTELQRKATVLAADMPQLTPKQWAFVLNLVGRSMTAAQAYRDAYNAHHYTPQCAAVRAYELKQHPNVRMWIQALRQAEMVETVSRESYIGQLQAMAGRAEEAGAWSAAVNAMGQIGKAMGHLSGRNGPSRVEDIDDSTLLAQLRTLIGDDAAERLQVQLTGVQATISVAPKRDLQTIDAKPLDESE